MRWLKRILVTVVAVLLLVTALDFVFPTSMGPMWLKLQRNIAGLELRNTQIPEFRISYLEGGAGAPLVLLHGYGADKDNFAMAAVGLSHHFHLYIPDLPGFGDSSKPADASYHIADQVQRVHQFITAMGLKKVHLGGSSMGGWIAAQYAITYPDAVASLWLLDPAGIAGKDLNFVTMHYAKTGELSLIARSTDQYQNILDAVFTHEPFIPHSVKVILAQRAVADAALHLQIFHQLEQDPPINAGFAKLQIPILVAWGEDDRVLSPRAAALLKQLNPAHVQVKTYAQTGHLPMLEAPFASTRDYLAFREALPASP